MAPARKGFTKASSSSYPFHLPIGDSKNKGNQSLFYTQPPCSDIDTKQINTENTLVWVLSKMNGGM
ncbi:hypothetical protein HBH56_216010 [Parastagonospora nodorum]|uniref:Uncharacterized protein n=1 Tax=Phaeosphaeria nodorum (strain SN15 / ATCC MYA-4574 / FGSC 10173) TaxID=321614 RepID=A0A7U2HZL0_PHANO|nr:hypothetical protein HBH56_216010 [Parastagonospora nodorum]QRC93897.1 hypothetical protein JI435_404730 [Parastagonospora nodorum SN15]KAH3922612.1 hypothetical protein HBH54_221500 [Parastagonospora nodorum]KAH3942154.1 hypothetical protein HBH53_191400 [Parastagonospora nodorum]KAH3963240.1 hypothetical protein HBH52_220000 [Parastagonospora nodorum]